MNKKVLITIGVIASLLIILMVFGGPKGDKQVVIETEVLFGSFKVEVNTSGELEAENSTKILGPQLNKIRIWNATIEDIVDEGTVVDSGAFVAKIDASEVADKLNEETLNLEMAENRFSTTQLDTTLELRQLRDNLINLHFALEESEIKLEQSKFEPPATIRQEEINMARAKRTHQQALEAYKVKVKQANAKMKDASINLNKRSARLTKITEVQKELTIFAPKTGMVIYTKHWDGNKIKKGSRINSWNPVVAELPDLTKMISKTYVNEIDISKISIGQGVKIGVDAFPELSFTGSVTQIANIGEQLKNSDAKVFEVTIKVNEMDSSLRPAMTTSNEILISKFDSVLFAPIEAVFGNDSINWVYKQAGLSTTKQQVLIGQSNENDVIIVQGVNAGEKLSLSIPTNDEKLELVEIYN